MKTEHIPRATIERLSIYLQVLESLKLEGVEVISSGPLADACNVNASQIRKDLTYFGEFGVRGVGYNVRELIKSISHSLGIDRQWNCVIVGVGNMGRALLGHRAFAQHGFPVVGAFDCDPFKIGEEIAGLEVVCTRRLKEKVADLDVRLGIIATPPERAQRAANHIVEAGIKGILNYAPARISVPEDVTVEYVDFFHHLYSLAFTISSQKN
ncbi:redox-sensing transcriptional repressor Rex [Desulfovibrio sp. OttesenSCG-928-G15]|nr:redox-sensing transcriptional repressor Rex [Desulfovibrio sp. OttesenSCG-928-G15]